VSCSEYEFKEKYRIYTEPNFTQLDSEYNTDTYIQPSLTPQDILFVVDNSCSMDNEQELLTSNFNAFVTKFLASDGKYHLGVISTDMDNLNHQGSLRQSNGERWIDNKTLDPMNTFLDMALMGTTGSGYERGKDAIYSALELKHNEENKGFLRYEAELHIVVISDEDDDSTDEIISDTEFKEWLSAFEAVKPRITFSDITPSSVTDYSQFTKLYDGVSYSVSDPNWGSMLDTLGLIIFKSERIYCLSHQPILETLEVVILREDIVYVPEKNIDYFYTKIQNAIVLSETYLEEEDRIIITYEIKI